MLHKTTPDVQDQDQDQDWIFWSQTGLVLRPTVSDHIPGYGDISTFRVPPFNVTRGNWNRYGSIGYLWLRISDHGNRGPISYRFGDKRRFRSKMLQIFLSVFNATANGVPIGILGWPVMPKNRTMPRPASNQWHPGFLSRRGYSGSGDGLAWAMRPHPKLIGSYLTALHRLSTADAVGVSQLESLSYPRLPHSQNRFCLWHRVNSHGIGYSKYKVVSKHFVPRSCTYGCGTINNTADKNAESRRGRAPCSAP